MVVVTGLDEFGDDALGERGGGGERDVLAAAEVADREHRPGGRHQRAAAVTGVDGGVGLNRVGNPIPRREGDETGDAGGRGPVQVVGVADGDDLLPDDGVGVGERERRRGVGERVDFDDSEVAVRVRTDDVPGAPVALVEADGRLARSADDVGVRDDVRGVVHEPGALTVTRPHQHHGVDGLSVDFRVRAV